MPTTKEGFQQKLQARRALVKALSKARRVKAPPQRFPREAVLSYKKELLALTAHLARIVIKELTDELPSLFPANIQTIDSRGFRTDASKKDIERVVNGIKIKIGRTYTESLGQRAAKKVAGQIDTVNKAQFGRQFKSALGIDITALNPNVSSRINEFIADNVTLIKSIEERYLFDIQSTLEESAAKGLHVSEVMDLIKERGQVSESRAELIARDQVNKLNGGLTQVRQENLGVTKYIWRTAQDERVRETHQDLDGLTFSWDDPPDTGTGFNHPGFDFQCRCQAEPILNDILGDLPDTEFIEGNLSGL